MNLTDEIRNLINSDLSFSEKQEALLALDIPLENHDEIFNVCRFRPYHLRTPFLLGTTPSDFENESRRRWENYIAYLKRVAQTKRYDPNEQIRSIFDSTDRIYRYFRHSYHQNRPTYGLVVGDVQSGKTANFCGLISKAADFGIQLIVVLSGTTNTLRHQTQKRIDEAFGRNDTGSRDWTFFTEQDREVLNRTGDVKIKSGDFTRDKEQIDLEQYFHTGEACLLVVKKRQHALQRLTRWLGRHENLLSGKQILFIDDESDSASVNCVRRHEDDEDNPDVDAREATLINEYIRTCIALSNHSIYIGYTATPYAALLTDPWDMSPELGLSLYPRDFILTLPQPSEHNGTTEFFSDFGYLRHQVSQLPRQDVEMVNQLEPDVIPLSLQQAIIDFIITGAIKLGEKSQFHHSMLVHCSNRKLNHDNLELIIRHFGMGLARDYRRINMDMSRNNEYMQMKARWEDEFEVSPEDEIHMDRLVKRFFRGFDWQSNVRSINSSEDDADDAPLYDVPKKLDYEDHPDGLWVIAVGGQILSRGLTVEGLIVSYFTRESALYDSLTQMARWYGYHGDLHSLIRVNISDQILRWFRWIHQVEATIREDIARYDDFPETTPLMLAPRILRYAETEPLPWEDRPRDFRPTRRNAMATAERRGLGFAGTYHSSRYLPLNNPGQLYSNQESYRNLIENLEGDWEETSGGYILRDVIGEGIDHVINFLREFHHSDGERSLRQDEVLEYINRRRMDGELVNWSVAVMSPQNNRIATLDRPNSTLPEINVTGRGRNLGGSLDEIMDKIHVAVDLPNYPAAFRGVASVRLAARRERSPENGLILLYLLDSEFVPREGRRGFIPLFHEDQEKVDAVAFGLALPDSQSGQDEDGDEYWSARGVSGDL